LKKQKSAFRNPALVCCFGFLLALLAGCMTDPAQSCADDLNSTLHLEWRKNGLTPVSPADDAAFLRRVRLSLTGRAPARDEIRDFCADKASDKRAKLIRRLLNTEEYADMMAMRYADIFRVKSEFPINLWPNAVQVCSRYLREAAAQDKPFCELAREMLTASGSNFRVAPANYFRAAADHTPEGLAKMTAMTWLGIRLEKLPPHVTKDMAPFFSRIAMKSTGEWKEQIVYLNPAEKVVTATAPDGTKFTVHSPAQDPRAVFADWLIADHDLQFSKAWVNRAWFWMFGTPLAGTQPDDMPVPAGWPSASSAPVPELNANLLAELAGEFHRNGGKMRLLLETICLTDAYQADWKTVPAEQAKAAACFAVYPVHRHDAEVILDLLGDLTGRRERYKSVIPEPFTILPPETRAVQVLDGSISTGTLDTFGRPPRDSGLAAERNNAVTGAQRLYLMNSTALYNAIRTMCEKKMLTKFKKQTELVDACYLAVLSRHATKAEQDAMKKYAKTLPQKGRLRTVAMDLIWCLVNSKEFLYQH